MSYDDMTKVFPSTSTGKSLGLESINPNALRLEFSDVVVAENLVEYLENYMGGGFNAACAADDVECKVKSANIAAYINSLSADPWCSTDSSSSSLPNDSSSSSESSSSSTAATDFPATVEFVYPTPSANLGGATQTKVVLRVIDTKDVAGNVDSVSLGSIALIKDGDLWVADDVDVQLNVDDQVFDAVVTVAGQTLDANDLVLNNLTLNAGNTRVGTARGITIDEDSGVLYHSNPYAATVSRFNGVTGESEVVYQGTQSPKESSSLYWPIAIDSANDTVYLSADSFNFGEVGTAKTTVQLVKIDESGAEVFPDTNNRIESTHSLVLDLDSQSPSSSINGRKLPAVYSLDAKAQSPLQRWFLGANGFAVSPASVTSANDESSINPSLGMLALAGNIDGDNSKFLIAREFDNAESRGNSSLIEVTTTTDDFGGVTISSTKLTELDSGLKPTALLYNKAGTSVYIATFNAIWLMDLNNFNLTLISSSNTAGIVKGTGPSIANVTAMALHPTLNYLYLAADTSGVVMVDLANGNRVTSIK